MGMMRPVGQATATASTPTPVFTGPSANLLTATSFSILKGIATIVLSNTYIANDIVGLYGFSTATYFNGVPVTVLDSSATQFRFYFNHADVASTSDAGSCFIQPQTYRAVKVEIAEDASTSKIYVGDGGVTTTKYFEVLSLTNKPFIELDGDSIPAGRVHITTDNTGTKAQISLIY